MAGLVSVDYKAVLAGGVVVVGLAWLAKREAVSVAKAIDPTNDENVINQAVQTAWGQVTDGQGTIGTDSYDAFHHSDGQFKWPWQADHGLGL